MNIINNNSLMHYGVLGMKWGVRKDGMPQGYKGSGSKPRWTDTNELATKHEIRRENAARKREAIEKSKNRKLLTDAELDKAIERLEKEKKLRNLTEEEVTPGRKVLKEIMSNAGKKVATAAVVATSAVLLMNLAEQSQNNDLILIAKDIHKLVTKAK